MYKVQEKWEKRATVRSRPHIKFNSNEKGYLFPLNEQLLMMHPLVAKLGAHEQDYLLTQSLYKYFNDIASIETRVVNTTILSILNDKLPIKFDSEQKVELYTIMIDEAYHAYVAYDALLQIEQHTNTIRLPLPETIEIEVAMAKSKEFLDPKYHGVFELICVCIAENTLTKEIIAMVDAAETHPFFQKLIKDHLSDEARHSVIFFQLLTYIWQSIDDDCKYQLANVIVFFLENYLGLTVQIEFEKKILSQLGFSMYNINSIMEDTYGGFKLSKENPKLKNILTQISKAGLIDEFLSPTLNAKGWL